MEFTGIAEFIRNEKRIVGEDHQAMDAAIASAKETNYTAG